MKLPTLGECEKAIGEPASAWVARCYEIACKIVKAGLVSRERGLGGEAVYGHWVGSISPRSYFADRRSLGFVQHGWIWIEDRCMVIDPTRFVFEAKAPYIYADYEPADGYERCKHCQMIREEHDWLGANEECALFEPELWPYDEGGNRWREAMRLKKPPPKAKRGDKNEKLVLSAEMARFVGDLLGQPDGTRATAEQIFWLANLPYSVLSRAGANGLKEIYEAICDAGSYYIEFIPLDNRIKAKREAGFARK
jgi:hypothetical protein